MLLVAMPYVHPTSTSLALGLLGPILRRAGIAVDCLYGALRYPRTPLWDTDAGLRFLVNFGGLLFGSQLARDDAERAAFIDFMSREYEAEVSVGKLETQGHLAGAPSQYVRDMVTREVENCRTCIDRCAAEACDPAYDIVGVSVTFFTQLPASIALARRLKANHPGVKIVFGGSGCVDVQAEAFVRAFPELDAVASTEADDTIVALVGALRGERDLADVPGLAYRDAEGAVHVTPPPPLRRDLDSLPMPDHDAYFEQHARSEWADTRAILYFETSRGCWWGQKHLCTFCGLSERELAFRAKSADRLYDEITYLHRRHPNSAYLHPTDDILDTRYFADLFPRLARYREESDQPLTLFFEVKSNMRAAQLLLLASAGVGAVQPGIESFSDEILELMDKGNTGLGQVQFIKFAAEAGMGLVYNLLLRNPGDRRESYEEMLALMPFLRHLPPPSSTVLVELERFSPYFRDPTRFGIRDVHAKAYHRAIFPDLGAADLDAIAYRFDYDHDCMHDAELIRAQRRLAAVVNEWRRTYRAGLLLYAERGDHIVICDERNGKRELTVVGGRAAELFRFLGAHRSFRAIRARFPDLDEGLVRAQLEAWRRRGFVYGTPGDDLLALVPRGWEHVLSVDEILDLMRVPGPPRLQVLAAGAAS